MKVTIKHRYVNSLGDEVIADYEAQLINVTWKDGEWIAIISDEGVLFSVEASEIAEWEG